MSRQEDFKKKRNEYVDSYCYENEITSNEMIDAIDETFDSAAEYGYQYAQDHPNWISVEERLPDTDNCGNSDFYLVHDVAGDDHVAYYNKLDNEWYTIDGIAIFVTHWMPIVPPKTKE